MRAQFISILTLSASLSVSITAVAQAPRPAPAPAAGVPNPNTPNATVAPAAGAPRPAAAPAAAAVPNAAAARPGVAAPAQPNAGQQPAAGPGDGNTIALRDAPQATNPVLAAFTPVQGGLTANEVALKAVASSDTITAKNAELRAAAAAVDSAMYAFYPRLSLKASYTRMSPVDVSLGGSMVGTTRTGPVYTTNLPAPDPNNPDGRPPGATGVLMEAQAQPFAFQIPKNYYSLGASLTVPLSDYVLRLSDSIDATKKTQESSELNLKAERQKVEADARVAFYNWTLSIGQVAVTQKSLERVRARLKDAQTAFTLGAATKADVLRLQALVASTEAALEAALSFKMLAEEQLAVIMDTKAEPYPLGEDVLANKSIVPLQSLDTLVQEANANRYELKALDRTADSMRSAETVLRRGQLPRIDGFADYTYANPNQRYLFVYAWKQTWDVGLAATWNINEIFTNGSSANEMVAKRQSVEANRKAMAKGIRVEVSSAYAEARRTAAELESAKRAAEAAQSAYDTEVELFKVGKATTTELIDAESELVNALLKLISAHIGTRVAETKIARATGRDMHTLTN